MQRCDCHKTTLRRKTPSGQRNCVEPSRTACTYHPEAGSEQETKPARRGQTSYRQRSADAPDRTPRPSLAGRVLPAGCHLRRAGCEFRTVQRPCREGRAVPVRPTRAARARAGGAARVHRSGLARLSAGRPSGPALRLPGLWALRARARASLQPSQAAAGPVRQAASGPAALVGRPFRLPRRWPPGGSAVRLARQCPRHAQVPRDRHRIHLGWRQAAQHSLARQRPLRDPPAWLHHAAPGCAANMCVAPLPGSRCRQ